MPYTDPWENTDPPGTEAAKNIDNIFRKMRLQIDERMTGSLVEDWKADPVVPLNPGGGLNRVIIIPHNAFVAKTVATNATYTNTAIQSLSTEIVFAPLILPQYSTLKGVSFLVNKNDCTNISCNLIQYVFTPAFTLTVPVNIVQSVAGWNMVDSAGIDILVDGTAAFYISFNAVGGSSYFVSGARVLYATP